MKKSLLQDSMDFIFDNFLNITLFVLFLVLYSGYIITHGLFLPKRIIFFELTFDCCIICLPKNPDAPVRIIVI